MEHEATCFVRLFSCRVHYEKNAFFSKWIVMGIVPGCYHRSRKCSENRKGMGWMKAAGHYIGTPNGIVLCVSKKDRGIVEGCLYHGYSREGIPFCGYEEIIKAAETFFNELGFPYMGTGDRDISGRTYRYRKKEGMTKVMKDEELLGQHGDMGTFVIRVQHRQHSSWQGRVTYLDENQTVYFRSALELMKIIDSTLDGTRQPENGEKKSEEG